MLDNLVQKVREQVRDRQAQARAGVAGAPRTLRSPLVAPPIRPPSTLGISDFND